ncbi:MAG: hypothetical protein J7D60_07245 [Prosthecochloris sp.]|nr:hypothetical protein [Prosthecochloris sp.]
MSIPIDLPFLSELLGIPESIPLSTREMELRLQVFIDERGTCSPRMKDFISSLGNCFRLIGVRVLSEQEARPENGRFKPGVVIIAPGHYEDEDLAINSVSTLYNNIIVGIHDEPARLTPGSGPQEKLDAIVSRLAWDMVHISIYLDADSWTICTMNGGVVTLKGASPRPSDIRDTLVPKLTAQVVPPKSSDLELLPGTFPSEPEGFTQIAAEFRECARLWSDNDYLLTHTSRESLTYRSPLYQKIVARYLDQRSGMSYGFFAHQTPTATRPAEPVEHPGACRRNGYRVPVRIRGSWYLVEPAPVTVITTRSGCRKTDIDPSSDLLSITLDRGRITLRTPATSEESHPVRPSFDTLTILAHALGNAFAASLLQTIRPSWNFARSLEEHGASMTHWHGYPDDIPEFDGYFVHGQNNPPVSCSTPQSAVYSFLGKFDALEQALAANIPYQGDIHIEPNHGTNIIGSLSLSTTAARINRKSVELH